ncbi:hypothetical protein [Streptomyces sp. NPDC004286]|uniref:hypothetical protein n=1 Tax=Streptomyces sp. NPDC004286 TaxID=3364696 RepID=UPI0036BE9CDF
MYGKERPATTIAVLGIAALCAVGLAAAGAYSPRPHRPEHAPGTDMSRFLATLERYRPAGEVAVRTGTSQEGLPTAVRIDPPERHKQYRLAFQCLGPGQATTVVVEIDGSRHGYPVHPCRARPALASVAAGDATLVVIQPTDPHGQILWALTRSRQPPSPTPGL